MRARVAAGLLAIAAGLLAAALRADEVVLTNGTRIEGKVLSEKCKRCSGAGRPRADTDRVQNVSHAGSCRGDGRLHVSDA